MNQCLGRIPSNLIVSIYTLNQIDLYFWRFSNQNKGHLGSRHIPMISTTYADKNRTLRRRFETKNPLGMDHRENGGWYLLGWVSLIINPITLSETNSSHLKMGLPKRKLIFQPQCFRCELLVLGRVIHPYIVTIYWGPYPFLKGSNRGSSTVRGPGFPRIFPMNRWCLLHHLRLRWHFISQGGSKYWLPLDPKNH